MDVSLSGHSCYIIASQRVIFKIDGHFSLCAQVRPPQLSVFPLRVFFHIRGADTHRKQNTALSFIQQLLITKAFFW